MYNKSVGFGRDAFIYKQITVLSPFPWSRLKPWDSWESLHVISKGHLFSLQGSLISGQLLLDSSIFDKEKHGRANSSYRGLKKPVYMPTFLHGVTPLLTLSQMQDGENDKMKCRFYEKRYPVPEELVLVKVTDVGDMGAYAKLLEYNNMEGFILLPEMGRRRVRSKATRLKVNRLEVVRVIRVDIEKGSFIYFHQAYPLLYLTATSSPQ